MGKKVKGEDVRKIRMMLEAGMKTRDIVMISGWGKDTVNRVRKDCYDDFGNYVRPAYPSDVGLRKNGKKAVDVLPEYPGQVSMEEYFIPADKKEISTEQIIRALREIARIITEVVGHEE